jgi:hypothetical protein
MPLKELDAVPELRDDPSLKDFNDLPALAKSYKETKAFVGSSIRPPGPDASPEARKEFYDKLVKHAPELVPLRDGDAEAEKVVWGKLGRPAKREEYAYKPPDGVDINIEALRDAAEVAGLTKAQFTKLAEKTAAGAQQQALALQKDRDALKAEWGAAYETKLKNAAAMAQKLGQPESVTGAILAGKVSSAALKTWDAIATAVGAEGKGLAGQHGGHTGDVLTPAEADARFREIQSHPAYFNKNHPEHEVYVQKGINLMKQLHPD